MEWEGLPTPVGSPTPGIQQWGDSLRPFLLLLKQSSQAIAASGNRPMHLPGQPLVRWRCHSRAPPPLSVQSWKTGAMPCRVPGQFPRGLLERRCCLDASACLLLPTERSTALLVMDMGGHRKSRGSLPSHDGGGHVCEMQEGSPIRFCSSRASKGSARRGECAGAKLQPESCRGQCKSRRVPDGQQWSECRA